MSGMATVRIGNRVIGDGHPVFVIADVGLTNGGDLERTFELIDIAKDLGVDAVKFQMIGPDFLLSDHDRTYTYPTKNDGPQTENMYEMFSGLNYTLAEWKQIANGVKSAGMEFICTSHYMGAVDILEECQVDCHKICTWSVTHKRLIQKLGKTGKPMFMDMGSSSEHGLLELIDWFVHAGGSTIMPLHDFHTTKLSDMNFRSINKLKQICASPVGFTAPDEKTHLDFMAMGIGINILEKRLTHDKTIPKNGHWKSLDPDEFKEWLGTIKELEQALGSNIIKPSRGDLETSKWAFKSLFAIKDIKSGELITDQMIDGRRPGTGISAKCIDDIIGRHAQMDINKGTMLDWAMID
jgi:sialic acid synthase SpsE